MLSPLALAGMPDKDESSGHATPAGHVCNGAVRKDRLFSVSGLYDFWADRALSNAENMPFVDLSPGKISSGPACRLESTT
jgi:hypothetical protein